MRPRAVAALLLLCLSPLAAAAAAQTTPPTPMAPLERDHPLVGRIWLPAGGRFITADELVARARSVRAVLLGETHDNPDHHALQAWMLGRIITGAAKPVVAFEMIDNGQEDTLRRHLAAHPGDADGLGAALEWDKSGWPDWALYRPIAETALQAGAALAPANLTRAQVRAIAKGEVADALPPQTDADARAMAHEIKAGHCDMLPEAAVPGMVRVQRSRDAAMAEALARGSADGGTAVLIAGAGHVRTDRAVPAVLAHRQPAIASLAVAFLEVKAGATDPAAYGGLFDADRVPFDAVWFTPRAEREDQCEALRRHLDKKKAG